MAHYRYIPVFQRSAEGINLYRCFEVLGQGFCVQSKDRVSQNMTALDRQFLELFGEQAPELRFAPHPSLEAAIAAFDAYFQD